MQGAYSPASAGRASGFAPDAIDENELEARVRTAPRPIPPPRVAPPARLASRAGTELALTLGAVVHLHRDKDFRPVPLGVRAGHQFDAGLYLGAAGEWSLSLPNDRTSGSGYYQLAGELAYDYSPLANVGAIPFARAGYTSTFQSHCEHRKLPAPCEMTLARSRLLGARPLRAPDSQSLQHGSQRPPLLGQGIFDPRRDFGEQLALQDGVLFERPQAISECLWIHVVDRTA